MVVAEEEVVLVVLIREVIIDGAVVEEEDEAGVEGVVMVKTMARGKQRRRAHRRENGVGDSMIEEFLPSAMR